MAVVPRFESRVGKHYFLDSPNPRPTTPSSKLATFQTAQDRMYWFRSFFVVGAWKSEQVQDVHELIAPADRLSLVRRLPAVAS
jgi:hypothetical protein